MNNIIFRGKDAYTKEWIEGYHVLGSFEKGGNFHTILKPDEHEINDIIFTESLAMYTGLKDNTEWDELTDKEKKAWIDKCGLWNWLDASKPETEWGGKRIFGSIPVDGEMSKGGDILKDGNYIDKVVLRKGCFALEHIDKDIPDQSDKKYIPIFGCYYQFTKIGNQFDNPELLEE